MRRDRVSVLAQDKFVLWKDADRWAGLVLSQSLAVHVMPVTGFKGGFSRPGA